MKWAVLLEFLSLGGVDSPQPFARVSERNVQNSLQMPHVFGWGKSTPAGGVILPFEFRLEIRPSPQQQESEAK